MCPIVIYILIIFLKFCLDLFLAHQETYLRKDDRRTFYFNFSEVSATGTIENADLRLYKLLSNELLQEEEQYTLTLYRLAKRSTNE